MAPRMRLAWLFDIDGTLLLSGGAAREAFVRSVRDCLGRTDPLEEIGFAGRIDPEILAEILAKHGIPPSPELVERFYDRTVEHMAEVLPSRGGNLLPGVLGMLEAVAAEPTWARTLLTGNTTRMAGIKLRHFGIEQYFSMGAFGEQAASRPELALLAVGRVGERYGVPPERCVVIGDTVHDIACARAAGAVVVAVATGQSSRAELETHSPDLVLDDMTQHAALLAWARDIDGRLA